MVFSGTFNVLEEKLHALVPRLSVTGVLEVIFLSALQFTAPVVHGSHIGQTARVETMTQHPLLSLLVVFYLLH